MAKSRKKHFVSVGDVLASKYVNKRMSGLVNEYKLKSLWQEIVGASLAPKTEPAGLRNGLLTINVENPVLSNQLHFLKQEIIVKIRKVARDLKIDDIKFQVRNVSGRHLDIKRQQSETKPRITGTVPEDLKKILESSPLDRETRESLKNILLNSLERKNKKNG